MIKICFGYLMPFLLTVLFSVFVKNMVVLQDERTGIPRFVFLCAIVSGIIPYFNWFALVACIIIFAFTLDEYYIRIKDECYMNKLEKWLFGHRELCKPENKPDSGDDKTEQ